MNNINLKELYKNDKEFLKALENLKVKIKKYASYQNKIMSSPAKLYEFLEFDNEVSLEFESLVVYAHINNDLDLSNNLYQDYYGRVMTLYNEYSEISSFVLPEILKASYQDFKEMLKKDERLKAYDLNMKKVFRNKKLIKSENEEKLIAMLTTNYDKMESTSEYLINTDLDYGYIKDEKGKKVKLTNSNFANYIESSNKKVRKDAFNTFYAEIKNHKNTLASLLSANVSNDNQIAKIRGFKSSREYSLYQNEIKNDIYDHLINGVHKNLKNFYPYFDFKKKVLGLKEFHIYDAYGNITKKYNKTYSYSEAKDTILKALSVLGDKYISDLKKAFDQNWIDYDIKQNKKDGGYCTCAYLAHPYIVVNFEKKLNDVSTLAHELGHAMHYLYAMQNQEYQNYNYSIFVAEVASQVNEIILTDYLLKNSQDKEEKKYLLDLILQRFKATIVRQTMFAEFEDIIHTLDYNKVTLTTDLLEKKYYELNKLYFGPSVVVDEDISLECFRIPHFYYNFYVYQYATGYAAALKIASDIINNKKGALENYLKFLKLGSTKDPVSSLKVAGVDILDDKIYDEVFGVFNQRLNELRSLYE